MHVGMSVIFQNPGEKVPDAQIYAQDLALARLAEPLGFESIWSVEHHFTDYTMCPDVFQFLTYMAACTENVQARIDGVRASMARPDAGGRTESQCSTSCPAVGSSSEWAEAPAGGVRRLPGRDARSQETLRRVGRHGAHRARERLRASTTASSFASLAKTSGPGPPRRSVVGPMPPRCRPSRPRSWPRWAWGS